VPRFGPSLLVGREAAETLLYTGQRVVPRVLQADGFEFTYPDLEPALRGVLASS
jgi:NAD dependent epimerase/dehydratase family enzyme